MRAITQDRYGDTDALRLADVPVPVPTEGRVLVRVTAAGVNMADWHLMTGKPYVARLALGLRRPRAVVRGEDVAGVVEAIGPGVTRVAVGDRVFGSASGSFADSVLAREGVLARIPDGIDDATAAASPMAGYTAIAALRAARIGAGSRVVVTGAGGGVGGFVVQYAHAAGAHVTAVCSAAKADAARAAGADEVVDYAVEDVSRRAERWDAVIDFAGARSVRDWRRVLVRGGRLVLGGGEGGGPILGPTARAFPGLLATLGRRVSVTTLLAVADTAGIDRIAGDLADGTLRPSVGARYPLEEVPRAIDDLRAAAFPGKLVIVP